MTKGEIIAEHAKDTKEPALKKVAETVDKNEKRRARAKAAKTTPDRRVTKKRATPRKYDPVEMFEWYCQDATRTYEDVAKKFGTTKAYVKNLAAKEDTTWLERRLKVTEKLENKITKRRFKEAKERDESHLKSFRAAITANTNTIITEGNKKADRDIKAITASTNALYKAIMGERIILGLPVLIARSEITTDDEEVTTLKDAQVSAERMAERAAEIEAMRNNG